MHRCHSQEFPVQIAKQWYLKNNATRLHWILFYAFLYPYSKEAKSIVVLYVDDVKVELFNKRNHFCVNLYLCLCLMSSRSWLEKCKAFDKFLFLFLFLENRLQNYVDGQCRQSQSDHRASCNCRIYNFYIKSALIHI